MIGFFFYGIRDGVFSYYLNLLIYQLASGSGGTMILGFNITGRALVTMGVFFLLSSRITRRQGVAAMVGFAVAWPLLISGLYFWYNPLSVFLFSIADAGAQALVYNAMQVTSYQLCDKLSQDAETSRRVEIIGARNTVLCLGRIVGCLLFILVPAAAAYPIWALAGLSALAAPGTLFVRKAYRRLNP